jgi:hypothetical protein
MSYRKERHAAESSLTASLHSSEVIDKSSKFRRQPRWLSVFSVAACVVSFFLPVSAIAAPVMTRFNPNEHGFKFSNRFRNIFISELN